MKSTIRNRRRWIVALLVLGLAVSALPALAQNGGPYDLTWHRVAGGGGHSAGGPFALTGTIGQFEAQTAAGGDFALSGGLWGGGPLPPGPAFSFQIYLPVVMRNAAR